MMIPVKQIVFSLCLLLSMSAFSSAQEIDKSFLKGHDTALVIYNRSSGVVTNINPTVSARRFSPCSTFKIYNTLIGLELGLLKGPDDPWYEWDGVRRGIDGWDQDLTLRQAFRASAVPAFQILARQVGSERMKKYINQMDYGSKDISSGGDVFWLPQAGRTSIVISADEQVALLNKLLDGKLPFEKQNVAILRDVMEAAKTQKGTLYGKTGSGMGVGWFVGFLEHGGIVYVFACNITGGEGPSGKVARTIVENVFKSQGLL